MGVGVGGVGGGETKGDEGNAEDAETKGGEPKRDAGDPNDPAGKEIGEAAKEAKAAAVAARATAVKDAMEEVLGTWRDIALQYFRSEKLTLRLLGLEHLAAIFRHDKVPREEFLQVGFNRFNTKLVYKPHLNSS